MMEFHPIFGKDESIDLDPKNILKMAGAFTVSCGIIVAGGFALQHFQESKLAEMATGYETAVDAQL